MKNKAWVYSLNKRGLVLGMDMDIGYATSTLLENISRSMLRI